MKKPLTICIAMIIILGAGAPVRADWQRSPAPDVDKEFISGNPGLQPGTPPQDRSCWRPHLICWQAPAMVLELPSKTGLISVCGAY